LNLSVQFFILHSSCFCSENLELFNSSNSSMSNLGYIQMSLKDPLLSVSLFCHLVSIILCALILSGTLALYKSFTYLLTYLGSRRPAQASVKLGYPRKKWLFFCYWLVSRENRHILLIITSTSDEFLMLSTLMTLSDPEHPPKKIEGF